MKTRDLKKARHKPGASLKPGRLPYNRIVEFPQAKGRTVEMVELIADGDYHCVSIRFQDKTDLSVMIDAALTFRADFYEWENGNQRLVKRWPALRCEVG